MAPEDIDNSWVHVPNAAVCVRRWIDVDRHCPTVPRQIAALRSADRTDLSNTEAATEVPGVRDVNQRPEPGSFDLTEDCLQWSCQQAMTAGRAKNRDVHRCNHLFDPTGFDRDPVGIAANRELTRQKLQRRLGQHGVSNVGLP